MKVAKNGSQHGLSDSVLTSKERIKAFIRSFSLDVIKGIIVKALSDKVAAAVVVFAGAVLIFWKITLEGFSTLPSVFTDLNAGPPNVRVAFGLLLVLLVGALLAYVNSLLGNVSIRRQQGDVCPRYDRNRKTCDLGILELTCREKLPLHRVFESVEKSYSWSGLSASNEVGKTRDRERIHEKARHADVSYLLLDPNDTLRVREHAFHESGVRTVPFSCKNCELKPDCSEKGRGVENRDEKDGNRGVSSDLARATDNLRNQIQIAIKNLKKVERDRKVTVKLTRRLPWLRVTEIDESIYHLAHYDRGGCGFTGDILVAVKDCDFGDESTHNGNSLFTSWMRHFLDTERKNALIDDIYAYIVRAYCKGLKKDRLVEQVRSGEDFKTLRSDFEELFEWELDEETIANAFDFVVDRYGLNSIDKRICSLQNSEDNSCTLGVREIVMKGEETFPDVGKAEHSINYFGATGYHPTTRIVDSLSSKIKKSPKKYSIRFIANHPKDNAAALSRILLGRETSSLVPDVYPTLQDELIKDLRSSGSGESFVFYHNIIQSFRILSIDEKKMYLSFYQGNIPIDESPVLVLEGAENQPSGTISLYDWFSEHVVRMAYTATLWDVEREIWSRWVKAGKAPIDPPQQVEITNYFYQLLSERHLIFDKDKEKAEEMAKKVFEWVKKYQDEQSA